MNQQMEEVNENLNCDFDNQDAKLLVSDEKLDRSSPELWPEQSNC